MPSLHHFCSGLSRRIDFEAAIESGVTPGLQVGDFKGGMADAVLRHVRAGGAIFVDSGAFPAFSSGKVVDFDKVLHRYKVIAEAATRREGLFFVAPDKIADPDATLALLARYAPQLRELAALGVTLLTPLQRGSKSLADVWAEVQRILPGLALIPAMPMRAAVVTIKQVVAFLRETGIKQVHLLGTSSQAFVREIDLNCQGVQITADANRLRSAMGSDRRLTKECQQAVSDACEEAWSSGNDMELDATEFVFAALNIPGFLTNGEIAVLASQVPCPVGELKRALADGTFIEMAGEEYTDLLCIHVLPGIHRDRVRLQVGPRERKSAFIRHFIRTKPHLAELYLPLFAA